MRNNRYQMTLRWLSPSLLLIALLALSGGDWTTQTPTGVVGSTAQADDLQVPLVPWTAVASTGTVDSSALDRYTTTGACVGYRAMSNSVLPIVVRYNVTDPSRLDPIPGWTMLELGSSVPGVGNSIRASLVRVDPCTGEELEICAAFNNGSNANAVCTTCTFPPGAINFDQYLYEVRLSLSRVNLTSLPSACTLRLR